MNLSSKNLFWSLVNLTLILVIIFGVKGLVYKSFYKTDRTITVSAEGKVTVSPDIANVSFSVVSQGKDPELVQGENTEKMNTTINFIKSQGIETKDIKTVNYNLAPQYDYETRVYPLPKPNIVGYTLTQTVLVKVRDLNKVAPILAGLTAQGINQIESVSFDIEEPDRYLNEARAEAFRKAREKAEFMARENRVRIKRVVTFSEGFGGPIPYFAEALGRGGDVGAPQPVPPTIEPGTQEVTVQVSVTYEIR